MNSMHSNSDSALSDWDECPSGELQGLGQRLRTTHARRKQASTVTAVGAIAVVALLAFFVSPALINTPGTASITCTECQGRFVGYHAHLVGTELMDSKLFAETQGHLEYCELCRDEFEQQYPDLAPWSAAAAGVLLAALCLPKLYRPQTVRLRDI